MKILKSVEHLTQEQASSILAEALATRVLNEIKHVQEVATEVLRHHVDVRIVTIFLPLDMHDSIKVVAEHANEVLVLKPRVIFNLLLHLLLICGLHVGLRSQNLEYDLLATLVPVLSQVNLGIGPLVNLLLDLEALINQDSLVLNGSRAHVQFLLA